MGKRGRPKGSKNKVRRSRPSGSKKKKGRGRPKGSRNTLTYTSPILKVGVKCVICRKYHTIRTDKRDFHLYTPELKKNYVCLICKDTWKHRLLQKGLIKISKQGKVIYL